MGQQLPHSLPKVGVCWKLLAFICAITLSVGCQPMLLVTETELPSATSPSTTLEFPTDYPPEKQTFEAGEIQTQKALIHTITVSPAPTGDPPTYTPAPFESGLFEISQLPFGNPQLFAISTGWAGIVNGERTYIYAGARKDISGISPIITNGVVLLRVYSADLSNLNVAEYDAPAQGVLTIIAEANARLTLTTANGIQLYFDVPSRKFVDTLTATVTAPTTTPLPPMLGTPTPVSLPTGYPNLTSTPVLPTLTSHPASYPYSTGTPTLIQTQVAP